MIILIIIISDKWFSQICDIYFEVKSLVKEGK